MSWKEVWDTSKWSKRSGPRCLPMTRLKTSRHTSAHPPISLQTFGMTFTTPNPWGSAQSREDKTEKGFLHYMIGHFFVWTYPKDAHLMKTQFKIGIQYLEDKELWYWSAKIAALQGIKIVWSPDLDAPYTVIMALSIDGINFATWEKKHPTLNKDHDFYDHKHILLLQLQIWNSSQSTSLRLHGSNNQSGVERMIMVFFERMDCKISWYSELNSQETAIITLSVDGVNYLAREKKHLTLNKDPGFIITSTTLMAISMKKLSVYSLSLLGLKDQMVITISFERMDWKIN